MNILYFSKIICVLSTIEFTNSLTYQFIRNTTVDQCGSLSASCLCGFDKLEKSVIFLNGQLPIGRNDVPFSENFEAIFGSDVAIFESQSPETVDCKLSDTVADPPVSRNAHWHDPNSWLVIDSNVTYFLHAQMVPNNHDEALFSSNSAYNVSINIPVHVGGIRLNDIVHTQESFLEHIQTIEGSMQFHLSPDLAMDSVLNDFNFFTDTIVISESPCRDYSGCENSNLNKKTMTEICNHVTCPTDYPCRKPIKPDGHCCLLCGAHLKFEFTEDKFFYANLQQWLNYMAFKHQDVLFSLMKTIDHRMQVVIVLLSNETYNRDPVANALNDFISGLKPESLGIVQDSMRTYASSNIPIFDTAAIILTTLCLILIAVGAILAVKHRTKILNWFTRERISLRALWQPGNHEERLLLELSEQKSSSSTHHHSAVAQKLSAVPSAFKKLLTSTAEKAFKNGKNNDGVEGSKKKKRAFEDNQATFDNPVYETGAYSLQFED